MLIYGLKKNQPPWRGEFNLVKISEHERGSIVVIALLVFFIVCILVMMVIQLASLEMHMSEYYYRSLQAQQLADAGVEQCCAEISRSLRENYADKPIPSRPLGWQEQSYEIAGTEYPAACRVLFLDMILEADCCRYSILFKGSFANAQKEAQVELTFHFTHAANVDEKTPTIRVFNDYGIITDYKIIYN